MIKLDEVVKKETVYVAIWTAVFSLVMEAVFLLLSRWDITVLLGNLLGAVGAVLNFLLMGITVQNAVSKDEKDAKSLIRMSQSLRQFMLLGIAAVGFIFDCFNLIAVLVPILFPSIAVKLRMFRLKDKEKGGGSV